MSLTENIARRHYRPLELLAGIEQLRDQGYDKKAIVLKTGLSNEYVHGILTLLKNGEERLLIAVEKGRKALNVNPATISRKFALLDGICPEAAELLKDR